MRRLGFVGFVLVLCALAWPQLATADDNDLKLHRLARCAEGTQPGTTCIAQPDAEAFVNLTQGLGMVFAPAFLSPAESLGEAGFAVGFATKFSLPESGDYWRALDGVGPEGGDPGLLTQLQLHARKGLPFSFEIDGVMSWLTDSELFYIGGGLKWALSEGWLYVPDLAVRGSGGTVTGSPDMTLSTAGVDVSISKAFGLGGFFSLTPYAGYSHVWTIGSSRVIDADPGFGITPTGNYQPEFVFEDPEDAGESTIIRDQPRGFAGMRFVIDYFAFSVEGSWAERVQNYAINIGADF